MKLARVINVLLLLSTMFFLGCGNQEKEVSQQDRARQHLKKALLAIDSGDDALAESELKACLEIEQKNELAIITLSSLYARQSGIVLRSWFDPIMSISTIIRGRAKVYERALANARFLQLADRAAWWMLPPEVQEILASDARVSLIAGYLGKASVGAMVFVDVLQALPFFNNEEKEKLHLAIATLKAQSADANERSENVRVYLALLSLIELVDEFRKMVGSDLEKFADEQSSYCHLDPVLLESRLGNIDKAINDLADGLIVNPSDPPTSQRRSREKMAEFVRAFLANSEWQNRSEYFDGVSDRWNLSQKIGRALCFGPLPMPGIENSFL